MADLNLKTSEQIRDDFLQVIVQGLLMNGIIEPNVSPGTFDYLFATAFGEFGAQYNLNIERALVSAMPDSAEGDDLIKLCRNYNLFLRDAGGSSGSVVLDATIPNDILIPLGAQLIDPNGLSYEVVIGGPYSIGDLIPIRAIDTGAGTNIPGDTILKWTSPPAYVRETALVSTGGLTGGLDAETLEGLRTRLLEKLRNAPGSGNPSQLNQAAEESTVAVQKSFTYPAANGPATAHVAVVTSPTDFNKERDIDITTLSTVVAPAIFAQIPDYFELLVTTVQNQPVDISFGIAIPKATSSPIPGKGGGWLDARPFPTRVSQGRVEVVAILSPTNFVVSCDAVPTIGDRIVWISPIDWQTYRGVVLSFTGSLPNIQVVIDTPFSDLEMGHYIFPDAENMDDYITTMFTMFSELGPGQKTDLPGLLPRALRRPLVDESWNSDLDFNTIGILPDKHDEISTANYLYRPISTPNLPASIQEGPFILIPRNIGFYPLV